LLLGDFNVNSREELKDGVRDGSEYLELLDCLAGKKDKKDTEGVKFIVHDLLREQCGFHPVTYGDVARKDSDEILGYNVKKLKDLSEKEVGEIEKFVEDGESLDTALTFPEEYCSQQRLDYIFYLEVDAKNSTGDSGKCVSKVSFSDPLAQVEPFFVKDQKFIQLSDHYGVSAILQFTPTDLTG